MLWSSYFTVIITESAPKSRVHWIPSLETEIMIFGIFNNFEWLTVD